MREDCPIPHSTGWSEPEGLGTNGVLVLGEASGDAEAEDNLPFRPYAPSGSLLERAFKDMGTERRQYVLTNVLRCHPPGNLLTGKAYCGPAIAHCRPALLRVVEEYKPRCILALGDTAFHAVTNIPTEISRAQGFAVPSNIWPTLPVVGSFHPAFLRRGKMGLYGVFRQCLGRALAVAGGTQGLELPSTDPRYFEYPELEQLWKLLRQVRDNPGDWVYYDIETNYSSNVGEDESEELGDQDIKSLQIWFKGHGFYLDWADEGQAAIGEAILTLNNPKCGCNNWLFDDPVLARADVSLGGDIHDLRWMFHHLQPDLLTNLQFIAACMGWPWPWKHLDKASPRFYGIVDVHVLEYCVARVRRALEDKGLWVGYDRQVKGLRPVLAQMERRGMPVAPGDWEGACMTIGREAEARQARMQELVPEDLKPLHPKRKDKVTGVVEYGYKKTPKDTTGMMEVGGRWAKVLPFKDSHDQLIRYMRAQGHTVPKRFRSDDATTAELELRRLAKATGDPLYEAVLDYRDWKTVLSNHIPGWKPGADGRVHPTFLFAPAQGQLSSRRPNVQNAPRRKPETARIFRSMVKATPGRVLLEFDYKAFHPLTLGFESGSIHYMRLARMDIHAFLAAGLARAFDLDYLLGLGDEDLREKLAWVKREHKDLRNNQAKRAINGYGNGLGYRKMYYQNLEHFNSEGEAKKCLELIARTFPEVEAYKVNCRRLAHTQGYLISRYGYIRWFWEVMRFKPGRGWAPGDDSEAACAFLHCNDAFGIIKDAMLTLSASGGAERYGLINQIHDALLFECPLELEEEAKRVIKSAMEMPSGVLDGLSCPVEVKQGGVWAEM